MPIELPPLPYARDALAPHISAETLDFHHGKHHRAYVDKVNELVAGTPQAGQSLEEIVLESEGALFNAAAQAWNHAFYWRSMKPGGGGEPAGAVADAIRRDFGSYAEFRRLFKEAAVSRFGSGWAWLVLDGGRLKVTSTHDADLPMRHGQRALLACDVWEHAYYIDYRNARGRYVDAFLDHLIAWDWVARQLSGGPTPMTAPEYDAEAEAERLWHEIWTTIEDDVPTFAVGPYPPYQKVKAFEARLSDALRRAYQAGAASRRRTPRRGARSLSP